MPEWKCNNCGKENKTGMHTYPERYLCECGYVAYIQELDIVAQGWPEDVDELWGKAERLVQIISKGVGIDAADLNIGNGKEIMIFCPTCYRTRNGYVSEELFEKLDGGNHSMVNQCEYCREKGREVDLEHFRKVMTEKTLPLPKLDETTSFSDLIKELFERLDE